MIDAEHVGYSNEAQARRRAERIIAPPDGHWRSNYLVAKIAEHGTELMASTL